MYEQAGDSRSVAMALAQLGSLATVGGDPAVARERLAASLAMFEDLADTTSTAAMLDRFALLEAAHGRHEQALRLAGAAAARRSAAGASLSVSSQTKLDARLALARQALGDAALEAWRTGQALSLSEAVAAALHAPEPATARTRAVGDAGRGPAERVPATSLTAREREVAALIGRGLTNRQIGQRLVITEGTAASHVVHILDKLGYSSRAQVAVWAAEQGLLERAAG
jgi:DNA-binding NarL/FixJ family response regulator